MLGSTYLEILRDDLTNIYINSSMQFSKNKSVDKFRVTRRCTCLAHLAYFQYASISQSCVRLD